MSICIKDNIQNMNLVIGCTVGCSYCYARNNVKRYRMIDDFSKPEFFPNKLRLMERERPQNFLLTGMSDLAGWEPAWREKVFAKIRENPQHQFLFLSKRPDLLDLETDLENAWFGVTVTRRSELWRIDTLKANVRANHYHVTFEPLFDDPGKVDLSGISWIVVGTMTGAQSKKIRTAPEWAYSLVEQAHALGLEVLLELHSESELAYLSTVAADMVGINNRNLGSFVTDVANSFRIADRLRQQTSALLVSESGISSMETIQRLRAAGYRGFLLGEVFMKHSSPAEALKQFLQSEIQPRV